MLTRFPEALQAQSTKNITIATTVKCLENLTRLIKKEKTFRSFQDRF